jgi:hypothetical protein
MNEMDSINLIDVFKKKITFSITPLPFTLV